MDVDESTNPSPDRMQRNVSFHVDDCEERNVVVVAAADTTPDSPPLGGQRWTPPEERRGSLQRREPSNDSSTNFSEGLRVKVDFRSKKVKIFAAILMGSLATLIGLHFWYVSSGDNVSMIA